MVRHGETTWSRSGRHTSTTEIRLTRAGEEAARALAPRLAGQSFDLVLTSPRSRARQTAGLAGFPDAIVEPDLAEWAYGTCEGQTTAQIRARIPDWTIWTHGGEGGETVADMTQRMDRLVTRLRQVPGRILCFGHGHALRALAMRWVDAPVGMGVILDLDTATVSILGDDRGTPVIRRWNA